MLNSAESDSVVWSQLWRGRPDRQLLSLVKGATQVLMARLWSMDGLALAMWLQNLRQVVPMVCVSGGWSVCRRTFSLEMLALQEMRNIHRRHHWSNAYGSFITCHVRSLLVCKCYKERLSYLFLNGIQYKFSADWSIFWDHLQFHIFSFYNLTAPPPHHNHFTALFPGPRPPGEPVLEENFWTFMLQGKINWGRHRPSRWAPLHPD